MRTATAENMGPGAGVPVSIPLDAVSGAGTYVCNWNGQLLRVPPGAATPRGLAINIVGREPLFVTRISDDPRLPLERARERAAALRLLVGF